MRKWCEQAGQPLVLVRADGLKRRRSHVPACSSGSATAGRRWWTVGRWTEPTRKATRSRRSPLGCASGSAGRTCWRGAGTGQGRQPAVAGWVPAPVRSAGGRAVLSSGRRGGGHPRAGAVEVWSKLAGMTVSGDDARDNGGDVYLTAAGVVHWESMLDTLDIASDRWIDCPVLSAMHIQYRLDGSAAPTSGCS